jgi:Na+-driven multidrug efflux pump
VLAIGFVFAGIPPLVSAYFQALGKAAPSYLISIGTLVGLKIPLVVLLGLLGPLGVWWGLAAGELLAAVAALLVLRLRG